jgi:zinc protease
MRLQNRAQDATLASAWSSFLYLGRTFAWSKEQERQIMALTTADVVAALRKHVDPAQITIVKAGDFTKK